jgi:hypothetical protein
LGCYTRCGGGGWRQELVERASAIAPADQTPGPEVLHRKTKGIKLDRAIIIGCKLANRNKVFDDVRGDKNIVKVERTDMCSAGGHDWKSRTIPHNDCGRCGSGWGMGKRKYTGAGGHVCCCARIHVPFTH